MPLLCLTFSESHSKPAQALTGAGGPLWPFHLGIVILRGSSGREAIEGVPRVGCQARESAFLFLEEAAVAISWRLIAEGFISLY